MMRPTVVNFGTWVKDKLETANVKIAALSRETGITYPSLSNMLNSGNKGKIVRQDDDTVERIAAALKRLGAVEDEREVWVAAGFLVEGYKVVRADGWRDVTLPESHEDWPPELQEAMAYSAKLTPEAQKFVYCVWREQARYHADLALKALETQQEIEQAKRELAEIQKQKRAAMEGGQ